MWLFDYSELPNGTCYDSMLSVLLKTLGFQYQLYNLKYYSTQYFSIDYQNAGAITRTFIDGIAKRLFNIDTETYLSHEISDIHEHIKTNIYKSPISIWVDPYYCDWTPFYKKTHFTHLFYIIGVEEKEYIISDIYFNKTGLKAIPFRFIENYYGRVDIKNLLIRDAIADAFRPDKIKMHIYNIYHTTYKTSEKLTISDAELYIDFTSPHQAISTNDDIAYIIYTSGSTGSPKGVEVTREGLFNFIEGISEIIDFTPSKRITCLTTVSFDIFFLESIMALNKGLTVVLANEDEQRNPKLMAKFIQDNAVDMIQMTPSRMQLLLNHDKELPCLKNVKEIMIGGEPFALSLLRTLQEKTTAKIYNMYGPTETTIWSTVSDLTHKDRVDGIHQSVVVALETSETDKILQAFYTSDAALDQKEITDYLSSKLPEYMIPVISKRVESFIQTGNGKREN